ncbi:MAG: hypothetical protein F6K22_07995 [Okeania sp. SIO2F4]|uniref:hypothetical protein n=1 Tax=Okeania sp. SIO2F4 TaxID=2607790 RepID=UPI00142AE11B|nr:hypothetical protein [Okeania sp. SIO2F4]NES02792.1 hypothetical protein [Okeania sp. SIO2F4]
MLMVRAKPSYTDLTKQFIIQAKKKLIWLKDVTSTPLQQSLKDLDRRGEWPFAPTKTFLIVVLEKAKVLKLNLLNSCIRKSKQTARFVGAN